jgi:hypothetical protein
MAKLPPRIKVFRTQIGVKAWVVATSSKKAALEAWDVSRDLFATGEAVLTDDPKAINVAMTNIGKAVAMPFKKPGATRSVGARAKAKRK